MNRHTQPNRVMVLLMMLAAVGAGCSPSGQAEAGEPVSPSAIESTTTTEQPTTTLTAAALTSEVDDPVTLPDITALTPGVTYLTETEVPFLFSVAESDFAPWWGLPFDEWSASMVLGNLDASGSLSGPQLSLGVAEPGATRESVVAAMIASAQPIDYQQTEGLFGGRDTLILDGVFQDPGAARPRQILTGDNSSIEVIGETGRAYRSHVFEEDGRVFIISVEADPDQMPIVLAEAAQVFESLRIGDAG